MRHVASAVVSAAVAAAVVSAAGALYQSAVTTRVLVKKQNLFRY